MLDQTKKVPHNLFFLSFSPAFCLGVLYFLSYALHVGGENLKAESRRRYILCIIFEKANFFFLQLSRRRKTGFWATWYIILFQRIQWLKKTYMYAPIGRWEEETMYLRTTQGEEARNFWTWICIGQRLPFFKNYLLTFVRACGHLHETSGFYWTKQ